jgi:hypothetical protein
VTGTDKPVSDRAIALDDKSFRHTIDAPVDRNPPLAIGADPRKWVASFGKKALNVG